MIFLDYMLIVFLILLPFVLIGLGVYGAILMAHKRVRNVNRVYKNSRYGKEYMSPYPPMPPTPPVQPYYPWDGDPNSRSNDDA